MPGFPELVKERNGYGNGIYPQNVGASGSFLTSGTVNMANFARVMFEVSVGIITGTGAVQAGLQTGNNANGSDGTNFAGSTIGTNIAISNQQATFEFQYGATALVGAQYVRGFINATANASNVCGIIYGTDCRFPVASSFNASSVNSQIAA